MLSIAEIARVTVLFIMGSLRSSGAILSTLVFTALAFLCLAIQNLAGSDAARIAGGSFGMLASACSWWGAMAGFWTKVSPMYNTARRDVLSHPAGYNLSLDQGQPRRHESQGQLGRGSSFPWYICTRVARKRLASGGAHRSVVHGMGRQRS